MLMGSTPVWGSTPRPRHLPADPNRSLRATAAANASRAAGPSAPRAAPEPDSDEEDDGMLMGMSPDVGAGPGGLAGFMRQVGTWTGRVWEGGGRRNLRASGALGGNTCPADAEPSPPASGRARQNSTPPLRLAFCTSHPGQPPLPYIHQGVVAAPHSSHVDGPMQ